MRRCMEIVWKGNGVFAHQGGVQEWKPIVESPTVAAVRKLQDVEFGEWTAIYEIDRVLRESGRRETAQYLVATEMVVHHPRRTFEGAVFVTLTARQKRSCQCACTAVGHQATCLGRIPAGAEFQLALVERPVVVPRQFGFPRARYRDQIPVCLACAKAIRTVRHDEPSEPMTPRCYWAALDAGDWATVHKVNAAVADQMEKDAGDLVKKGERSAALGMRFDAQRIRNCTLAPFSRPERE